MAIKIGAVCDLTGPMSFMGIADANVARMVVDDINAAGGLLGGSAAVQQSGDLGREDLLGVVDLGAAERLQPAHDVVRLDLGQRAWRAGVALAGADKIDDLLVSQRQ